MNEYRRWASTRGPRHGVSRPRLGPEVLPAVAVEALREEGDVSEVDLPVAGGIPG